MAVVVQKSATLKIITTGRLSDSETVKEETFMKKKNKAKIKQIAKSVVCILLVLLTIMGFVLAGVS